MWNVHTICQINKHYQKSAGLKVFKNAVEGRAMGNWVQKLITKDGHEKVSR